MKTRITRLGLLLTVISITLLLSAVCARAANRFWTGAAAGGNANWATAANWSNNVAPVAGDALVFPPGIAKLVTTNNFTANTRFSGFTLQDDYVLRGNSADVTNVVQTSPSVNGRIELNIRLAHDVVFDASLATLNETGTLTLSNFVFTFAGTSATHQFDGTITDAPGASSRVIVDGEPFAFGSAGNRVTLNGTNNCPGPTLVTNTSTLIVNGSVTSQVIVATSATLGGTGSVGQLTVSGTVSPSGRLRIGGACVLASSATNIASIGGTTAGVDYDQLQCNGSVNLGSARLRIVRDPAFIPVLSNVFTIVDKLSSGAISGTFAGLPQGASTNLDGVTYAISYTNGTGNDVTLTVTDLNPALVTRMWLGGAANNNWTTAANWTAAVVPTNHLLFPRNAGHAICTNDFPVNTVFSALHFTASTTTNNYPLLRGNGIRLLSGVIATNLGGGGTVGLELPIKLAASQTFTNSSTNTVIELRSNLVVHPFTLNVRGVGAFRTSGDITGTNNANLVVVNNGHLIVNGLAGNLAVTNGGQLSGTGSVGAVTVSSGLLSPGDGATGILNIGGPLTLNASSTVSFNINSNAPGSGHDQLVVTNGNVSLGGATLTLSVAANITDVVGMSYTIIKVVAASNSVSGTFAGLAEGDEVDAAPLRFRISYAGGDGNDVVLTIIGAVPSGVQRSSFTVANQGDAIVCTAAPDHLAPFPNTHPPGFSFDQLLLFDNSASGGVGGGVVQGNLIRLERGIIGTNIQTVDHSEFAITAPLALNGDQTVFDRLHWQLTFADINLDGHALTFDTVNPGFGGVPGILVTGLVSGATSSSRLIKTGTEDLTLRPAAGVATYEGSTVVESNRLITIGNFASTIILKPLASLVATGTVGGILSTGGIVTVGILQSTGAVVFDAASQFHINLPSDPGATNAPRLTANAAVNPGGASLNLGYTFFPKGDTNYVIISKTSAGPVSGTFGGLPQNADFVLLGHHYRISYTGGDGNDVIIISTNNPPVITQVSDQTIIEQIPFNLQIAATDADPADELTFTLDPGSPTNSTISSVNATNALFSWTPTEDQGPGIFTVTVRATDNGFPSKTTAMSFQVNVLDTNLPPTMSAPATVTSNELTQIRFNVSAHDPDSPPANLIFALLQSPPGMTFSNTSSTNILVNWTPTEDQGPSTNAVIVRVTEAGGGPSSTQTVSVIAREVNVRPVMQPIAGTNVLPGAFIQRELIASDDDIPANPLTFQLVSPPAGATIVSNRFFQWTPATNQVGQTNISIRCFDTNPPAINATSLSTTQQFTVNVGVLRIVINTNDAGPGSLRQAIIEVNANLGGGEIRFAITNVSKKIAPTNAFETIKGPTTVDGYTQPGARPNQLTNGTDAIIVVQLSGENLPGGPGLSWKNNPTTIRGLCVNRFTNGTALVSGAVNCSGCGITSGSVVEGCFIGTDVSGTVALPNQFAIEFDQTHHSRIGGPNIAQRNLISGNRSDAILPTQGFDGAFVFNNTIQNNLIGCDRTGTNALGNGGYGITAPNGGVGGFGFSDHDCLIADNIFTANGSGGLVFAGANNLFVRNKIGVGADGVTPLGNHFVGIELAGNTNRVGTTNPADANIIAFNTGPGIHILDGTGHALLANQISHNAGLGIDLGGIGRIDNDSGDSDIGPNNLQNFPMLDAAASVSGGLTVSGSLNSASNTQYRLEFFITSDFSPNNQPQAGTFLSATNVTTDSSGNANFSITMPAPATDGFITATATDASGNTSEISDGIAVARLEILGGSTSVSIFWRTNLVNFLLQANGNVANRTGWTNVPGPNQLSPPFLFHTFNPVDPALFFRLKSQ